MRLIVVSYQSLPFLSTITIILNHNNASDLSRRPRHAHDKDSLQEDNHSQPQI